MSKAEDIIVDNRIDEKLLQDIRNQMKNHSRSKYTKWYMSGLLATSEEKAKELLENLVESDSNIFKKKQKEYFGVKNVWLYYWKD